MWHAYCICFTSVSCAEEDEKDNRSTDGHTRAGRVARIYIFVYQIFVCILYNINKKRSCDCLLVGVRGYKTNPRNSSMRELNLLRGELLNSPGNLNMIGSLCELESEQATIV